MTARSKILIDVWVGKSVAEEKKSVMKKLIILCEFPINTLKLSCKYMSHLL